MKPFIFLCEPVLSSRKRCAYVKACEYNSCRRELLLQFDETEETELEKIIESHGFQVFRFSGFQVFKTEN
tara:strand:+ start:12233 stop:12442 length:210 start_codon:yes stop_codon:yes gene_type:complete